MRTSNRLMMLGTTVVLAGLLAAPHAVQARGACTDEQRRTALVEDKRMVLARIGNLRTLDNLGDVALLALKGWSVFSHQHVSFAGMGVAVARPEALLGGPPTPGMPTLLMYAPRPGAPDTTDPYGADLPYRLVGWGYSAAYDPGNPPTSAGPCFEAAEWFVHERGIHDLRHWGFVARPPAEDYHGQHTGQKPVVPVPLGIPHSRLWDLHVFLDPETGVPRTGIVRPTGPPIPGIDPGVGKAFFHAMRFTKRGAGTLAGRLLLTGG